MSERPCSNVDRYNGQVAHLKAENAELKAERDAAPTGAWQTGPAPKDGTRILGVFGGAVHVVFFDSWPVGGEMLSDGTGSPPDGYESGWCLSGDSLCFMDSDEPERWALIKQVALAGKEE